MGDTIEQFEVIDNGEDGVTLVFKSGDASFGVNLSRDDADELADQLMGEGDDDSWGDSVHIEDDEENLP